MRRIVYTFALVIFLISISCKRTQKQEESALEKFTKSSKELKKMAIEVDSTFNDLTKKQPVN